MLLQLKNNQKMLTKALLEAEQDGTWVCLSDNPDGLISCGQANCYALIVKSKTNVALAHVSSVDSETLDFLNEMIEAMSGINHLDVSVFLARSPQAYTQAIAEDKQDCPSLKADDADVYFAKVDQEYRDIFAEHFKLIQPEFITMPHDFVVIDAKGDIQLFESYAFGTLTCVNAELTVAQNGSASSLGLFSSPSSQGSSRQDENDIGTASFKF